MTCDVIVAEGISHMWGGDEAVTCDVIVAEGISHM